MKRREFELDCDNIGLCFFELLLGRSETVGTDFLPREMLVSRDEAVEYIVGVDRLGDERVVIGEESAEENEGSHRSRDTVDASHAAENSRYISTR